MLRYRTQGLLAAGLGLLVTGCFSDPDLKTGLRPAGPPEVLAVLAVDQNLDGSPVATVADAEPAAYCKYDGTTLDEKAPALVQGATICPTDMTMFTPAELEPLSWQIRVVFDELLDADKVETLLDAEEVDDNGNPLPCTNESVHCQGHIDTTLPFDLSCGNVSVAYDGFYYPNGNKESYPIGPALVLTPPTFVVATGTTCTLTIKPSVVVDKDGVAIGTGANVNVFTLNVKELDVVATDPEDAEAVADRTSIAGDDPVVFQFNAPVDAASLAASEVEIRNLDTNAVVPSTAALDADTTVLVVASNATMPAGNYQASITANASFADELGGTRTFTAPVIVRFVVE